MARIRTIKPEFFLHEALAELTPLHRLYFIGLWTLADREGRLEFRPKRIKAALFPWDDANVAALTADLDRHGLVRMYAQDDQQYLVIPSFAKHQRPHPKEPASTIPSPPAECLRTNSREFPRPEQTSPFLSTAGSGCIPSSPVGREGKEILDNGKGKEPHPPAATGPVRPTVDPAVGSLRDRLEAEYFAAKKVRYRWRFEDDNAIRAILDEPEEEIVRRAAIALRAPFPLFRSFADLVRNWNAYAAPAPAAASPSATPPPPKRDPNRPTGVVKNEF